tara:strand:+ start:512 stop:1252 length:741 start_codon:yes stop_codon:yes gene_type:complete
MNKVISTAVIFVSSLVVVAGEGSVAMVTESSGGTTTKEYITLRSAALSGSPVEKHALFVFVYEGLPATDSHVTEAFEFLREAAEGGLAEAQFNLGYSYVNGELVQLNEQEGICWLQKAAHAGIRRANLWLGVTYLEQYKRVDKTDPDKAKELFEKLDFWLRSIVGSHDETDQVALAAEETLGRAYLRRSIFSEEGWSYLMSAASSGHTRAQETLRKMRAILQEELDGGFVEVEPLIDQIDSFFISE